MRVSVFILYYKEESKKELIDCITALKKSNHQDIELIVVNNGLKQGFEKEILEIFPNAKHIISNKNIGFTGGNIKALKHATGEIILLLNDDAIIHQEAITNAIKVFSSNQKIGIVGGKIFMLNDNHPPLREWNPYHTYQKINPFGGEAITSNFDPITANVDTVSGSMFFIRKKLIDEIGFLDENFFAYYEEADLAIRAQLNGWLVVYSSSIKLWHKDASTNPDPVRSKLFYYYLFRNQFLFAANNFSKSAFKEYLRRYFFRIINKGSIIKALKDAKSIERYFYQSVANNILNLPQTLLRRRSISSNRPKLEELLINNNLQDLTLVINKKINSEELEKFAGNTKLKFQELIIVATPTPELNSIASKINKEKSYPFIKFSNVVSSSLKLNASQKAIIESRSNNIVIANYLNTELLFNLILNLQNNAKLKFAVDSIKFPGIIMASKNNWLDYFEMQETKTIKQHLQDLPNKEVIDLNHQNKLELKLDNQKPKTKNNPLEYPVFINCRDRVEPLKKLLSWLKNEGVKDIILIDNNSTNPKLLKIYQSNQYEVIKLNYNSGHISLWNNRIISMFNKDQRFIYTDPDIIPENSAHGAILKFNYLLNKHSNIKKVGFGLKIDDLPDSYHLKKEVIKWEEKFWEDEIEPAVFKAPIDTTFALYRASTHYLHEPALRTGGKFTAKHEPWYTNSNNPSDDLLYYLERADRASNSWGSSKKDGIAHHQKVSKH